MAFSSTTSGAVAFGTGSTGSDDRALFLRVFGGEVLASFTAQTLMAGKTRTRAIASGKSAQFPLTGTATAEYMTRGKEALGNAFATHEREITIDGLLVSHYAVFDLDAALSHFDIRGPMATDMGGAIARVFDQNAMRSIALASRAAAVGQFPGGDNVTDASLTDVAGSIDGAAWLDAIRKAKIQKKQKNINAGPFYMVVPPAVFDAIKYAVNTQGQYILIDRNLGSGQGDIRSTWESVQFEGVTIFSTNLLPQSNDSANTDVWSKYRADFSKTKGLLWTPDAVGTLELLGLNIETFRDVRRQEDFMIARKACGHGTLRPECATEFRLP